MKTSLIITIFNRSHLLEKSLERLTHLTLPDEIIIVNDGGNDATEQVCKGYASRLPIKYIYNHNPSWSICSMARNIGVKNSTGDLIITSEPELLFVTDIIKQMVNKNIEFPDHVISVGTIYHMQSLKTPWNDTVYTDPKRYLEDSIVEDYQTEPRPYDESGFVKTKNLQATFCALYGKKWIEKVGGWDEDFPGAWGWDDIDLCTRLRIKGCNQVVDCDMEAIHQWHPHLPPHLQGPQSQQNEQHMIDKHLNKVTDKEDKRLIANRTHEWGVIKNKDK